MLLGNGVVANVLLQKTNGNNSGWIVITFGWGIAVFVGVFVAAKPSGAHLNPAITVALAFLGKIPWKVVPQYVLGQMLGAMLGATGVWAAYRQHFIDTDNVALKLAAFATGPSIPSVFHNVLTEIIASFVLVLGVLHIIAPSNSLGALDALPAALLVLGIGLSLGGPTGYATNPVRDLGPRIMHSILPLGDKGKSNWSYSWIPVVAPFIGAMLAALVYAFVLKQYQT